MEITIQLPFTEPLNDLPWLGLESGLSMIMFLYARLPADKQTTILQLLAEKSTITQRALVTCLRSSLADEMDSKLILYYSHSKLGARWSWVPLVETENVKSWTDTEDEMKRVRLWIHNVNKVENELLIGS